MLQTLAGEIAPVKENKWSLAVRIGLGLLLAILTGQINKYLAHIAPGSINTIKIATALLLAAALYVLVLRPLLEYADAQRKAKRDK
ncbi:hypothetical protein M2650_03465 [Luteimonas sp. SX5]|uniref:Uncharacterized protein n=1 Tax=Luteimonas galliterrae TaxID=2940486 RepID=A0ABT0MFQ5_9GAMM|nr:hypothetical protein [Luteimonas galliterrae]